MRVLVVGLGSMGKRRVRDLVRLEAGPVAGFDPREDRRTEARERYGIDVYTDFDEALTRHEPDAVVVSTPPDRHKEYALASVSRGLHTFTELNLDPSVVDALIAAHRGPGIVIAPSATMRLHPAIVRMRSLLEGRAFGPALVFTYHTGQWLPDWHPWEDYRDFFASRAATGACREILAIELSWLVWLFGPVDAVQAQRAKLSSLDADIDDVYQVILEFRSRVLGHVLVDAIARPAVRFFRMCAEGGTIEWDAGSGSLRRYDVASAAWQSETEQSAGLEPDTAGRESMYLSEMRDFLGACRGDAPYAYGLEEERDVLRVLTAIDDSAGEGRRVLIARRPAPG